MRTAILFGCGMIADAININPGHSKEYLCVAGVVVIICMGMDIVDFFRNKK